MGSLHCLRFKYKLIKNGTLTAVCDISPERRQWAEKNPPGVTFFEDYKELMESGLVDAVLIATPHYPPTPKWARPLWPEGFTPLSKSPRASLPPP